MYIHIQIIKLNTYLQITNYLPSLLSQTQSVFFCLSFILTDLLKVLGMVVYHGITCKIIPQKKKTYQTNQSTLERLAPGPVRI